MKKCKKDYYFRNQNDYLIMSSIIGFWENQFLWALLIFIWLFGPDSIYTETPFVKITQNWSRLFGL